MRHIESLDGVRALAVLLVVLYHLNYLPSGWIGVQIFFVLSGYLITAILVQDRERFAIGAFARRFYWRRTLRIVPLYYGYLLAITAAHLLVRNVAADLPHLWPYVYGYGMDFARMRAVDEGSHWFGHLWSLAIEEQFYLVWPWVVFYASPKTLRRIIVAVLVAAPMLRLILGWLIPGTPEYVGRVLYVFPLSQFDTFATGAAIAVFPLSAIHRARRWFLAGLAIILALGLANRALAGRAMPLTTFGYPLNLASDLQWVWGYTALNLTAGLMVLASTRGTPVLRLFQHPHFTRIGRISYGVYLFHVPLVMLYGALPFAVAWKSGGPMSIALTGGYLLLLWAVAEGSYRVYEQRFLALKDRMPVPLRVRATPEPTS